MGGKVLPFVKKHKGKHKNGGNGSIKSENPLLDVSPLRLMKMRGSDVENALFSVFDSRGWWGEAGRFRIPEKVVLFPSEGGFVLCDKASTHLLQHKNFPDLKKDPYLVFEHIRKFFFYVSVYKGKYRLVCVGFRDKEKQPYSNEGQVWAGKEPKESLLGEFMAAMDDSPTTNKPKPL